MAPDDKSRLNPSHSLRNLTADNTPTSRWRRNRTSPNLVDQVAHSAPAPTYPPRPKTPSRLERGPSKMSLFNLFSKPKVEKAMGHTEVGLAVPMQPQTPPKPPASPPKSALRPNPPPPVQQAARLRTSQLLRPLSLKPTEINRPPGNWEPPPLFQAYPQSLKYATVQSCVFSADVLLRTHSQRKQAEQLRERMDSHRDLAATLEHSAETKKLEKSHKRLVSHSVLHPPTPQLVNKIYVLVTSGHVLQYSGDGSLDRLPEKVLKLGKESAAFACDLIPGKHWVLQISQQAHDDGTVAIGPKNSLLSRLRLQNASARRAATSFLLVLENAEEMDAWMTAVRREIDSLGGMKMKPESIRESSSIDEAPEKKVAESPSQRFYVQRETRGVSKLAPVDSPLQSQYSDSPKIVASDWEGDRSERTVSITDSSSQHSSGQSTSAMRKSMEAASIATTTVSHDQIQLDQLRERSRQSYMSTATSVSGAGTRNTSRTSSPAPTPVSPLKEDFSPPSADAEPLRRATSLRSFHMNPSNSTATKRRSMQPLPVTNEDSSVSAAASSTPQWHSNGPMSPPIREPGKLELEIPASAPTEASPPKPTDVSPAPTSNPRFSTPVDPHLQPLTLFQNQNRNQVPTRFSARSSSAPPTRNGTISPPPKDPAPGPPTRPQSTIGGFQSTAAQNPRSERRVSSAHKPFFRPFPVRPQNADSSVVVSRRSSVSPTPSSTPTNRSVTTPARPPSATANVTSPSQYGSSFSSGPAGQQLRRPNSVQIRNDRAPFLSSSRPVHTVSNTPSFVPGRRISSAPAPAPAPAAAPAPAPAFTPTPHITTAGNLHSSPSVPTIKQPAPSQAQKTVTPRRSMPVMGLPPPAPPPNMPLPPPPPVSTHRPVPV